MREISEVRAKLELLIDFLYKIFEDLVNLKNKLELLEEIEEVELEVEEDDSVSDAEKACRVQSKAKVCRK